MPRADHVQLRAWSQAIVHMYEQDVDQTTRDEAVAAAAAFADYVRGCWSSAARQPGDDLISDLLAERDGTTRLSDDELVASVVLLLNAGHEASVNVFGNGAHALLTHPDQLDRITSGAVPMATALEELIRYDAPLQLFERTATADVEVAGRHRAERPEGGLPDGVGEPRRARVRGCRRRSTSDATRTRTSASAWACTSASARRWPGSSSRSPSAGCSSAGPTWSSPHLHRVARPGC